MSRLGDSHGCCAHRQEPGLSPKRLRCSTQVRGVPDAIEVALVNIFAGEFEFKVVCLASDFQHAEANFFYVDCAAWVVV